MKKHSIIVIVLLAIVAMAAIPQQADAQARRRSKRVKVVQHRNVTVVKVHPRVVRRAHIRYAALPRWGTSVAVVPGGAVVIGARRHPYYFYNGIYYAHRANSYVVVRPARGIRIRVLPVGYRPIIMGPRNYYYYYGTFYTKVDNTEEYEVIDAPEGAIVDALPDGYEVKMINDTEYYVLDGVYYAEVDAPEMEGGVGYEVVKL